LIANHKPDEDPNTTSGDSPYTNDVSSSKADIIYTAHSYHTKVPPTAIATYLRHYTKPGDVVLDFFAGSGMTAVACRMVDQEQLAGSKNGHVRFRFPICIDLSPAATFISSVYLWPDQVDSFQQGASALLQAMNTSLELVSISLRMTSSNTSFGSRLCIVLHASERS
jgi:hypothetical protein